MLANYPQLNPISLIKQIVYYPIRLVLALLFELHISFFRDYTMRVVTVYNYRITGYAKLLKFVYRVVGGHRVALINDAMSLQELRKYISHASWDDKDGTFGHFDRYAGAEYGKHSYPEDIKSERFGSLIKHNFPVFFVFEYLLKNISQVVEYGSGDCRNYAYTKGNIAGAYFGIDISRAAINRAKEMYPQNDERFVYVESLASIYSGHEKICKVIQKGGAALLCYVLCHLLHDESEELLNHCMEHHDYVVIHDSLTLEMASRSLPAHAELSNRHINYFEFSKNQNFDVLSLFYHPICMSLTGAPFLKHGNCAFTMIMGRKGKELGNLQK